MLAYYSSIAYKLVMFTQEGNIVNVMLFQSLNRIDR